MKKVFLIIFVVFFIGCDSTQPELTSSPTGTFTSESPVSLISEGSSNGDLIITVEDGKMIDGKYIHPQGKLNINGFDQEFDNPNIFFRFEIVGIDYQIPYRFEGEFSENGDQIRAQISNRELEIRRVFIFNRTN